MATALSELTNLQRKQTMNTNPPSNWQRGFWSLMVTQFQNAFSDNALKNLVILLVLVRPMSEAERNTHVALAGAIFAAPFIAFSMFGGWLADRFSKQRVMSFVKIAEVFIMLFAALALGLKNLPMELFSVFLMGCHSAIFGPSKYGILPEVLPFEKLSWGNGILELLTFVGIIMGTMMGSLFVGTFSSNQSISGLILAALALVGWAFSRHITPVPAANPSCVLRINPVTELWKQLRLMKPDRDLWRANWANVSFCLLAALVQMNLVIYAKDVLHLSEAHNGLLNAALAIGIGVGCVIAGFASRGHIEYGFVPLGAAGMALTAFIMGFSGLSITVFSICLVALGLAGGLFIVPVTAVIQHRPAADSKGAVQGAANLLSFVGILMASGVQVFLNQVLHFTPAEVFWACGVMALFIGFYAFATRPDALRRLFSAKPEGSH